VSAGWLTGGVGVHVSKIEISGHITEFSRAIPQIRQRGYNHREVFSHQVTFDGGIELLLFFPGA
jgi:hypothetical protein